MKNALTFRHQGQEQLEPRFAGVLSAVAQQLGGLNINSGYRSPEYNRQVKGACNSLHMHGTAADIDMSGMSPSQRAHLVQALRGEGATGFITYSNSPDMLHVDMRPGAAHFMYDKSSRNMERAPDWFKAVANGSDTFDRSPISSQAPRGMAAVISGERQQTPAQSAIEGMAGGRAMTQSKRRRVEDPALLEMLNSPERSAQRRKVTDPAILRQLNDAPVEPTTDPVTTPKQDRIGAWSPQSEADLAEQISGTSSFSDMTGTGIAKAVPFGDEIASGLNAPFRAAREWWQGDGFDVGRAYDRNMQVEEELQKRRDERSPIASTAGAVTGALAAGAAAVKGGLTLMQGARPTIPSLVGRAATESAAYGAAYGAGEGRGLGERARNAAWGGGIGLGLGATVGTVARVGAGGVADDAIPSLARLREAKNAAYDATDSLGIQYKAASYVDLVKDIVADARSKGINPQRHPRAASLISDMVKEARAGTAPTLRQLDEFRQIVYRDIGVDGAEQFFGNRMVGKIDDFIDNARLGDTLTGDPAIAGDAVRYARELNRRYRNSQTVNTALEKAERRALANNSGGNVENKVRQNLASLLDRPSTAKFLNADEKRAIEQVIRGTKTQNTARSLGNWAKGFGGHSLAGGSVAAAVLTGNPVPVAGAAVPYLAGSALKSLSRSIGNNSERAAELLVRTGKSLSPELSPLRKAVVDAVARGGAQTLPGYIDR